MSDFIRTHKAWLCIAKMLYPAHELAKTYPRDHWFINRYRPPHRDWRTDGITFKHQPASLLPGGISHVTGFQQAGRPAFAPAYTDDGKISAPKKLISRVDKAYFRQSLRDAVNRWFDKRGFKRTQPTISKEDFEASKKDFEATLAKPSARPVGKLKGDAVPKFVKNYLDSEPKPTLTGIRKNWSDAGHGAQARELLDDEYREQARDRNISVKRGPKRILQK